MKVRIISALIAILVAIPFVYFGGNIFALGMGVVAIQGFREVLALNKTHGKIPFVPSFIALLSMLLIVYTDYIGIALSSDLKTILLFCFIGLLIPTVIYKNNKYSMQDAFNLIGMVLFLGFAFSSFVNIRAQGLNIFLYLVSIPIFTDTFAYFVGRKIGKHKMGVISPNKSWEGFISGLVFGTILPCIFYKFVIGSLSIKLIIMTTILSCLGQLGDLVFSKLKRENDIKDYSNIMPGHGGALDRLDSTITIFMAYLLLSTLL